MRYLKDAPAVIETGEHLKLARHALGWSVAELTRALLLAPGPSSERRIREMEDGGREISGPIRIAVLAYLDGWRPHTFKDMDIHERS